MKVVWTATGKRDYTAHIQFLLSRNAKKAASDFIERISRLTLLLANEPTAFQLYKNDDIRKVIVPKYKISLYYKVDEQLEEVAILRLRHDAQDPDAAFLD